MKLFVVDTKILLILCRKFTYSFISHQANKSKHLWLSKQYSANDTNHLERAHEDPFYVHSYLNFYLAIPLLFCKFHIWSINDVLCMNTIKFPKDVPINIFSFLFIAFWWRHCLLQVPSSKIEVIRKYSYQEMMFLDN